MQDEAEMSFPPTKPQPPTVVPRRETLARLVLGGGVLLLGGFAYATYRLVRPSGRAEPREVHTGLSPNTMGRAVVTLPRLFVLRDSQGAVVAFDRRCTHQACRVRATSGGSAFLCPCHGSRFDLEGSPRGGPAKRPLRKLRTSLDAKGRVVVHFDR